MKLTFIVCPQITFMGKYSHMPSEFEDVSYFFVMSSTIAFLRTEDDVDKEDLFVTVIFSHLCL